MICVVAFNPIKNGAVCTTKSVHQDAQPAPAGAVQGAWGSPQQAKDFN